MSLKTVQQNPSAQPEKPLRLYALLPLASGALLCGAMSALSLIAVPVMLDTTNDQVQLVRQFVTMYGYGHQALPGLAILTGVLYGRLARESRVHRSISWWKFALAGLATVCIIPFTLLIMKPTNDTLFSLEKGRVIGPGVASGLLKRWGQLHMMRSLMPLVGVVIGMWAFTSKE